MHSPTVEEVAHWREKQELKAHNYLEELGKPDDLNDLIMTKVNLIVEKLSQRCDAREVRDDIATLIEFLQIRKSKKDYKDRFGL